MTKLLMILGVAGLLAGCNLMDKSADATSATDAAAMATSADDSSGTHTNSQEQDQDQSHTQGTN